MIQVSGRPFQPSESWKTDKIENVIIEALETAQNVYSYPSEQELLFEIKARKNIISSAHQMDEGKADFATFKNAQCNSEYWDITAPGGFLLKQQVHPGEGIQDIFTNSALYKFECATACVINFYHGILLTIKSPKFNTLFPDLYLYSWHSSHNLGLYSFYSDHAIPGDVVYFNNPDVAPKNPWLRGVNAVVMGNDLFFGHGFGIRTENKVIEGLNKKRRPDSQQSAYLTSLITRPSFNPSTRLLPRNAGEAYPPIIHHNKNSLSFIHYLLELKFQLYR